MHSVTWGALEVEAVLENRDIGFVEAAGSSAS
jgi:hypothetical protein